MYIWLHERLILITNVGKHVPIYTQTRPQDIQSPPENLLGPSKYTIWMSRENRIDGQKIPSLCRRIAGEVEIPFFLLTLGKAKSFDYMANVSAHMGVDSGVA